MRRPAPRGGQRPDVPDNSGSPCVGGEDYFHASVAQPDPVEYAWTLLRAARDGLESNNAEVRGWLSDMIWQFLQTHPEAPNADH